jgi:hypothetical protein
MDDIKARSGSELISILESINIKVPLRTEGRSTEDCERWSICRLLATLAKNNLLKYPVEVHHRNKPDFRIRIGQDIIGVEVTEAIPQDLARADALMEREFLIIGCSSTTTYCLQYRYSKSVLNISPKTSDHLIGILARNST